MPASVQLWDRVDISVVAKPASVQLWDRVDISVVAKPASVQLWDYTEIYLAPMYDAVIGVFDEVGFEYDMNINTVIGVFDEIVSESPALRRVWDGAQWVRSPEYVWNGTSWQQVV